MMSLAKLKSEWPDFFAVFDHQEQNRFWGLFGLSLGLHELL